MHCIHDPIGEQEASIRERMRQITEAEIQAFGDLLEEVPDNVQSFRLSDRGVRASMLLDSTRGTYQDFGMGFSDSERAEDARQYVLTKLSANSEYLSSLLVLEYAALFGPKLATHTPVVGRGFVAYCVPNDDMVDEEEASRQDQLPFLVV